MNIMSFKLKIIGKITWGRSPEALFYQFFLFRFTRDALAVNLLLLCGGVLQNPGPATVKCFKCTYCFDHTKKINKEIKYGK